MAITFIPTRTTVTSNGDASPLSGTYYPKPSYVDEPFFQEIDGDMHFLIQPWMKTVCFDDGVYDWTDNAGLLQDVYIAPPLDDAAGWNIGDKITLRFSMGFSDAGTDLVYFGFYDEDVYMDNITIGGDNDLLNDGQYETDYGYGLFEYYPLESNDGYSDYNVFEFHKQAQNISGEGSNASISSINLKSYVYANNGVDVYDIVYPY